jgi:glycerate kinase
MVRELDGGMRHFAGLVERVTGTDPADMSGAGAAGGLGGALMAFMNARLCRGADMVLDAVGFDRAIANADLIITGEGRIDSQTATGKLPYAVAKRSSGIPVLGICGMAEVDSLPCFRKIVQVTPPDMPLSKAMNAIVAAGNIRKAIMDILSLESL